LVGIERGLPNRRAQKKYYNSELLRWAGTHSYLREAQKKRGIGQKPSDSAFVEKYALSWRLAGGERDSTYPAFCKLLISTNIASNTHEYRGFFTFRPFRCFRPVRPVEPISAFYGQDGQEAEAAFLLSTDSARSFEIEFKFEFRDCYAYQPKPYCRLRRESF
jgi:hypothetical protein